MYFNLPVAFSLKLYVDFKLYTNKEKQKSFDFRFRVRPFLTASILILAHSGQESF